MAFSALSLPKTMLCWPMTSSASQLVVSFMARPPMTSICEPLLTTLHEDMALGKGPVTLEFAGYRLRIQVKEGMERT